MSQNTHLDAVRRQLRSLSAGFLHGGFRLEGVPPCRRQKNAFRVMRVNSGAQQFLRGFHFPKVLACRNHAVTVENVLVTNLRGKGDSSHAGCQKWFNLVENLPVANLEDEGDSSQAGCQNWFNFRVRSCNPVAIQLQSSCKPQLQTSRT